MALFDSKQEIIDIELTSYGKKKLSQGKLKPAFYAFFDDDVVYDGAYGLLTESANSVADLRIRKQTPYLKTQYSLVGSETKVNKGNADQETLDNVRIYENNNLLKFGLGNSKVGEVTGSRVQITMLEGEISNVYTTASAFVFGNDRNPKVAYNKPQTKLVLEAPELTPEIRRLPEPTMTTPPELLDPDGLEMAVVSPVLSDNKYVYLNVDEILISLDELNSVEDYKNFEVSLYKVDLNDNNEEEYSRLSFKTQRKEVDENGFLLDEREISNQDVEITKDNVEYYFDIQIDEEIDAELLTSKVPKDSLGRPTIDDPLIRNTISIRQPTDFSRRREDDGEPC